ncbi:Hypothetical predicted protein [Paramuricea clavata]|uniref:Uncharacterized protein n=1 Tax=Paramuricea clavata TaxID=317549 RepID=A0A7D9HSV4_PARCT|nr:Hypothetical predicted protein [Paramuricea clavata]
MEFAVCQHFLDINAYFFTAVSKTKKSGSLRDNELDKDNFCVTKSKKRRTFNQSDEDWSTVSKMKKSDSRRDSELDKDNFPVSKTKKSGSLRDSELDKDNFCVTKSKKRRTFNQSNEDWSTVSKMKKSDSRRDSELDKDNFPVTKSKKRKTFNQSDEDWSPVTKSKKRKTFNQSDEDWSTISKTKKSGSRRESELDRDNFPDRSRSPLYCSKTKSSSTKRKGKQEHHKWTRDEKRAVLEHLDNHIREEKVPNKDECDAYKQKSGGALDKRDWKAIKYYIKNQIYKRKKITKRM